MEKNLKAHRDALAQFKQRMGQVNGEKAQLNRELSEAREQLKALNAQLEGLKNATPAPGEGSQQLKAELAKLRMEKATVDRALAEERAKQANATPAANVNALQAQIVSTSCCASFFSGRYSFRLSGFFDCRAGSFEDGDGGSFICACVEG